MPFRGVPSYPVLLKGSEQGEGPAASFLKALSGVQRAIREKHQLVALIFVQERDHPCISQYS